MMPENPSDNKTNTDHQISLSDYGEGPEITIRKKLGKDVGAEMKKHLFKMFMKAKKKEIR